MLLEPDFGFPMLDVVLLSKLSNREGDVGEFFKEVEGEDFIEMNEVGETEDWSLVISGPQPK